MPHTGDLALDGFQRLQKLIQEHYKDDGNIAAVVCCWLQASNMWYLTICRYRGEYAEERSIVASVKDSDWSKALYLLTEQWMSQTMDFAGYRERMYDWLKEAAWIGK